jgi:hypothetical protein
MGRRTKAGLYLMVLAGAAFGTRWLFWGSHEGTAARVADWLESGTHCPGVNTRTFRLPLVGPDYAYAEPYERLLADQAREYKAIICEGVNGSLDFYRFSSTTARVRAEAGDPDLRRLLYCDSGAEILVDELLFQPTPTVAYCRRLRFQLHRPLNLYPAVPIYPNSPIYPDGPIRSTLTVAQFGGPHVAIQVGAGGKRLSAQGTIACRHPDEQVRVLALITQAQTKAQAAAKSPAHCRVAERNKNGSFASWKLTLTAFGPARFSAGKAVIAFAYYRGTPLLRFFARRGYVRLIAH